MTYYFHETTGGPGATDSGWQASTSYTDTGLSPSTTYTYQVMARDGSGNQTAYSVPASATTSATADTTPPTPNPMTWASVPTATSPTAISMTASTANDPSVPVQYSFEETSGNPGGTSSGWQTSSSYTDGGLSPSTTYSYRVQARDSALNVGGYSSTLSATTPTGADVTPPTPNPATFSTAPHAVSAYEISMIATVATDPTPPVQYWFHESTGHAGAVDSGWQVSNGYANAGLAPGTLYTWSTKSRDGALNETAYSAPVSVATTSVGVTNLVFTTQPVTTAAGATMANVVVQLRLSGGGDVALAGVPITVSGPTFYSGTTTVSTDASGKSTLSNLVIRVTSQAYTLTAASTGYTSATSTSFAVTPAPPVRLGWQAQPANTVAGTVIGPVTVRLADAYDNAIPTAGISVTVTLNNGTLYSGTPTKVTDANGIAHFDNLVVRAKATGLTLTATATGYVSAVSSTFAVTQAPAYSLVFTRQPTNVVAGVPIGSVVVQIRDAYGNDVTGTLIPITIGLVNGTLTGGARTQTSLVDGSATFTSLTITTAGGPMWFTATSVPLNAGTSTDFSVTAASATQLVVMVAPSSTGTTGFPFARQPTIGLLDALGNVVTADSTTVVTASLASGNGTLLGTTSILANHGVAAFAGLGPTASGTMTLRFSAPGLTSATSQSIVVADMPFPPGTIQFQGNVIFKPGNMTGAISGQITLKP